MSQDESSDMILSQEQNQRMIALRAAAETMSSRGSMLSGLGNRFGPPTALPGDLVRMAQWIMTGNHIIVISGASYIDRDKKSGWITASLDDETTDPDEIADGMIKISQAVSKVFEQEVKRVDEAIGFRPEDTMIKYDDVPMDWEGKKAQWDALPESDKRKWHSNWRNEHLEHPQMPGSYLSGMSEFERQVNWDNLTYDAKVLQIRPFAWDGPAGSDGPRIPTRIVDARFTNEPGSTVRVEEGS